MKVAIFALAVLAVVSANPAANQEWHWVSPMPKFSPNIKEMPLEDVVQFVIPPHKRMSPKFGKAVAGCGTPAVQDSKIVGGTEATPHAYPWQAALYIDNKYFCGGSLISPEWVLTAGHCTTGAQSIEVVLGAHDKSVNEPTQVTQVTTNIITHENYGPIFIHNDIGLVKLNTPVDYTSAIVPLCLPSFSDAEIGVGEELTATGWGLTSDAPLATTSKTLNQVTVTSISNDECIQTYGANVVTADVLCVSTTGGHGTCSGDSGGPLTIAPGGTYVSRGIVSFGSSSGCTTGYPAGFTRTKYFLDWIQTNTGILIDA